MTLKPVYDMRRKLIYCFANLALITFAGGATVLFEAESAELVVAPFIRIKAADPPAGIEPVAGASKDEYLAVPQGAGNPPEVLGGKAEFEVEIPADGLYTMWIRAWWDDSCGNSVGVQIGDLAEFMIEDTTYKTWHWVRSPPRLSQLRLSAGSVRITLHNREDGIRIDQILLTTNRRFVPVGIEEP